MRDTLVFRATAAVVAGVLRDMPCTDLSSNDKVQITKNDGRVAKLKVALQNFILPRRVKVDDDSFEITLPEEPFPSEQLSQLLDRVTVYDVTLDDYVQSVAKKIISLLEREREKGKKIYMNYETKPFLKNVKSSQFLTFHVIEALSKKLNPVDLERIELHIPETPDREQLVVVVDDMSYSGKQLFEDNEYLNQQQITFFLVGCTEKAYNLLTKQKNWNVLRQLKNFIPVADDLHSDVRKYVDVTTEDHSAGALGFVPWKIPDSLSTFAKFWNGYVYIGHAIKDEEVDEEDKDDLFWIPIDWSPEFDVSAKVNKESIFDNSHRAPFYKHPLNALPCQQAQTTALSRTLGKTVDELNAPLTIDEPSKRLKI